MGSNPSMNQYCLAFRQYSRRFSQPIATAHGTWSVREGLIVRIEDAETGFLGFGEIAPLPEFGSETQETAKAFLEDLGTHTTGKDLESAIAEAPVATAFGLSTALSGLFDPVSTRTAALISINRFNEEQIDRLTDEGFGTFKVKLGLGTPEKEWKSLKSLVDCLRPDQVLRLDPNQSWTSPVWRFWKPRLEEVASAVEFLEEPFPVDTDTDYLRDQADSSPVELALDERLADGALFDWCKQGWNGYWIIKPSLLGNPERWLTPLSGYRKKVIISSTFETGIGVSALVRLTEKFPSRDHGLGTQSFFEDELRSPESGVHTTTLDASGQQEIWNRLQGS